MTRSSHLNLWSSMVVKYIVFLIFSTISSVALSCDWKVAITQYSNNSYQEIIPGDKKQPVSFSLTEDGKVFANCTTYKEVDFNINDDPFSYENDQPRTSRERIRQWLNEGVFIERVELICGYVDSTHYVRANALKFKNRNTNQEDIIIGHLNLSSKTNNIVNMTDIIISCFKQE